jgi:hypothetical protein
MSARCIYANDLASPSNSYASIEILAGAADFRRVKCNAAPKGERLYRRNDHAHARAETVLRPASRHAASDIAPAYDHVGDAYGCYADGDGIDEPETATNRSAHADAIVWQAICKSLDEVRGQGVSRVRILDARCGPGTWLNRVVARARRQGLDVEAVGFDISSGQLDIARKRTTGLLSRCRDSGRARKSNSCSTAWSIPYPGRTATSMSSCATLPS